MVGVDGQRNFFNYIIFIISY